MNRVKKIALLFFAAIVFVGCNNNITDSEPTFDHTVIIYIVADNNLISDAVSNINTLESLYSEQCGAKVLIFYNSTSETQILEVVSDNSYNIASTVLYTYDYDTTDPNDPATLSDAIDRCRSFSKTDKYALILWSHASGWLPEGMSPAKTSSASVEFYEGDNSLIIGDSSSDVNSLQKTFGVTYSFDGEMEIYDLQEALPTDIKFEYIVADACYMGAIEIAYELKNNCTYFCGSAAEVLAEGFAYSKTFDYLVSGDVVGAAKQYYEYYNSLSGSSQSATIAVVESSKMSAVAAEMKKLVAIDTQLQALQQYGRYLGRSYDYTDLMWDAADMAEQSWGESVASEFVSALEDAVVYKAATSMLFSGDYYGEIAVNTFCGLSIYIPTLSEPETLEIYKSNYSWAKDSELYLLAK